MKITTSLYPPQSINCDQFLAVGTRKNGEVYATEFYTTERADVYKTDVESDFEWSAVSLMAKYDLFEWVE